MRFKDLAVGKYVTLNRWLSHYYNAYSEILEIVSVPDTKEDGKVGCRQVTKHSSIMEKDKYVDDRTTYIKYIHLLEVKNNPYDCRDYAVGDILVPTERMMFFNPIFASHAPYYINRIDRFGGCLRIYIRSCDGVMNRDYIANPLCFKKDGSVSIWRGFFATQYYKGDIKFSDDGKLVKPTSVVKGSPVYNQIIEEAKACGIIKG